MANAIDLFDFETFRYRLRIAFGIRPRTRGVPAMLAAFARVMDTLTTAR
jgi:hypothetical protein